MTSPCRAPDEPKWWPEKPPRRQWLKPVRDNAGGVFFVCLIAALTVTGIAAVLFGLSVALSDCRDADAECRRRGGVWVESVITYECVEPAREKKP